MMATMQKRKGHAGVSNDRHTTSCNDHQTSFSKQPTSPATEEDRDDWKGFCEIESDPAFFDVMLRNFGVKGVKVLEVFGLDDELLSMLPQPVYGLIFLFKWIEDDPERQEPSCPEGVWFANQTVGNACASVALLNIVNNVPGIELGGPLEQFKAFTKDFTPALRGDQIGNFEFLKRIHNSFARKMDMLNCDLALKNETHSKKTKVGRTKYDYTSDGIDVSYHFIAFVPIDGNLWKLDGLERQPQNLGRCDSKDWLSLAKPHIESRIMGYEGEQIEFSLLGLARDPMCNLRVSLAENVKDLQGLQQQMDKLEPGWREERFQNLKTEGLLLGPDIAYGLTQDNIDSAELSEEIKGLLLEGDMSSLEETWSSLARGQTHLRANIVEEEQSTRRDDDRAANRRHDYGPFVQKWIQVLARKGVLRELLE